MLTDSFSVDLVIVSVYKKRLITETERLNTEKWPQNLFQD